MNSNKFVKKSEAATAPSQIFKRSTTRLMRKAESKVPYYFQSYSDFYKEYLHALDDYFTMCYLLEHKLFENKISDGSNWIKKLDESVWSGTNISISQIETAANIYHLFAQVQISWIRTFDKQLHLMIDYFNKSNLNPPRPKPSKKRR